MNINTETLNEFLALTSHVSTWENARPGMWVRSRKTDGWLPTPITDDPYTTLPIAVGLTPEGNDTEAILLMYGTATPVDDDGEVDVTQDPCRVRILIYFHDGAEQLAVQWQGQTIEGHEDMGLGMFPETLRQMRASQKAGEWS